MNSVLQNVLTNYSFPYPLSSRNCFRNDTSRSISLYSKKKYNQITQDKVVIYIKI